MIAGIIRLCFWKIYVHFFVFFLGRKKDKKEYEQKGSSLTLNSQSISAFYRLYSDFYIIAFKLLFLMF
jgi:hypothetical protein